MSFYSALFLSLRLVSSPFLIRSFISVGSWAVRRSHVDRFISSCANPFSNQIRFQSSSATVTMDSTGTVSERHFKDSFTANAQVDSNRQVIHADALQWMESLTDGFPPRSGVFTSLPDISEMPQIFSSGPMLQLQEYEDWFVDTVCLIFSKLPIGSFAIFLQSDIRLTDQNHDIVKWIDKSHLCNIAATKSNCKMMWHKLALLSSLETRSGGRPTYSHLLCFVKKAALDNLINREEPSSNNQTGSNSNVPWFPELGIQERYNCESFLTPDVFDRGEMLWSKAIGLNCALMGVAFLKEVGKVDYIIDPFCGEGTVLATANALDLKAIGVELSAKRCRKASQLQLKEKIDSIPHSIKSLMGVNAGARGRGKLTVVKPTLEESLEDTNRSLEPNRLKS